MNIALHYYTCNIHKYHNNTHYKFIVIIDTIVNFSKITIILPTLLITHYNIAYATKQTKYFNPAPYTRAVRTSHHASLF